MSVSLACAMLMAFRFVPAQESKCSLRSGLKTYDIFGSIQSIHFSGSDSGPCSITKRNHNTPSGMPDEILQAMLLTHPPIRAVQISNRQANPHPLCREVVRYRYIGNSTGATFRELLQETSGDIRPSSARHNDFQIQGGETWRMFPWSLDDVTGHDMLELLRLSNDELMAKIVAENSEDTPLEQA